MASGRVPKTVMTRISNPRVSQAEHARELFQSQRLRNKIRTFLNGSNVVAAVIEVVDGFDSLPHSRCMALKFGDTHRLLLRFIDAKKLIQLCFNSVTKLSFQAIVLPGASA